jgi:maleate isomerase
MAGLVEGLEARHDIAVHDTVATAVYGALVACGYDHRRVTGFGRLFQTAAPEGA